MVFFKIISEAGIAAGVRRLEALTGRMAEDYAAAQQTTLQGLADQLKVTPHGVFEKVGQLFEERKSLEREVQTLRQRLATSGGGGESQKAEIVNGVPFIKRHLKGLPPQDLKPIADELKAEHKNGVFVIVGENDGKVSLVISVSSDLLGRFNAVELIRKVVPTIGGNGGGGRPDLAQAGGSNAAGIPALFDALAAEISKVN